MADLNTTSWSEFKGDLVGAAKSWAAAPLLPIVSLALTTTPILLPRGLDLLGGLIYLISIGWFGTQRIWYLRIFREEMFGFQDALRFTRTMFGRFFCLGLLVAIPYLPAGLAAAGVLGSGDSVRVFREPGMLIIFSLTTVAIDILLTFVTPALAFSTRRVSEAGAAGIQLLRSAWPRCAWYALLPPVIYAGLIYSYRPDPQAASAVALLVLAETLRLLFKGATVAFYARRVEVPDGRQAEAEVEESTGS